MPACLPVYFYPHKLLYLNYFTYLISPQSITGTGTHTHTHTSAKLTGWAFSFLTYNLFYSPSPPIFFSLFLSFFLLQSRAE